MWHKAAVKMKHKVALSWINYGRAERWSSIWIKFSGAVREWGQTVKSRTARDNYSIFQLFLIFSEGIKFNHRFCISKLTATWLITSPERSSAKLTFTQRFPCGTVVITTFQVATAFQNGMSGENVNMSARRLWGRKRRAFDLLRLRESLKMLFLLIRVSKAVESFSIFF